MEEEILQKAELELIKAKEALEEIEALKNILKEAPLDVPYVPSSMRKVDIMVKKASIKPGAKAVDLGSGDGRVVIALAKAGAEVKGYEISKERAALASENIKKEGLQAKASILNEDFFKVDFSEYDVVVIYGLTDVMLRLEKKLFADLRPGSKVISNHFQFSEWKHSEEEDDIYVYEKKINTLEV